MKYTLQLVGRNIPLNERQANNLYKLLSEESPPKFIGIEDEIVQTNSIMGIFRDTSAVEIAAPARETLIAEAIKACGKCTNGIIRINRNTVAQCECIKQLNG